MKLSMFVLLCCLVSACQDSVETDATCAVSPDTIQYSTHVYPIIDKACAIPTCHVSGFEHGNFNQVADVISIAKKGNLEFMITTRQMPPGYTYGKSFLTACEISTIKAWIKNGALAN